MPRQGWHRPSRTTAAPRIRRPLHRRGPLHRPRPLRRRGPPPILRRGPLHRRGPPRIHLHGHRRGPPPIRRHGLRRHGRHQSRRLVGHHGTLANQVGSRSGELHRYVRQLRQVPRIRLTHRLIRPLDGVTPRSRAPDPVLSRLPGARTVIPDRRESTPAPQSSRRPPRPGLPLPPRLQHPPSSRPGRHPRQK